MLLRRAAEESWAEDGRGDATAEVDAATPSREGSRQPSLGTPAPAVATAPPSRAVSSVEVARRERSSLSLGGGRAAPSPEPFGDAPPTPPTPTTGLAATTNSMARPPRPAMQQPLLAMAPLPMAPLPRPRRSRLRPGLDQIDQCEDEAPTFEMGSPPHATRHPETPGLLYGETPATERPISRQGSQPANPFSPASPSRLQRRLSFSRAATPATNGRPSSSHGRRPSTPAGEVLALPSPPPQPPQLLMHMERYSLPLDVPPSPVPPTAPPPRNPHPRSVIARQNSTDRRLSDTPLGRLCLEKQRQLAVERGTFQGAASLMPRCRASAPQDEPEFSQMEAM